MKCFKFQQNAALLYTALTACTSLLIIFTVEFLDVVNEHRKCILNMGEPHLNLVFIAYLRLINAPYAKWQHTKINKSIVGLLQVTVWRPFCPPAALWVTERHQRGLILFAAYLDAESPPCSPFCTNVNGATQNPTNICYTHTYTHAHTCKNTHTYRNTNILSEEEGLISKKI